MRVSHLPAVLLLALLARVAVAQRTTPTLESLAAAWSAGQDTPRCAPTSDPVERLTGGERCEWPRVTRGRESGRVWGERDAVLGLGMLTWERNVADSTAARQLADSLSVAFKARGLTEHACPGEGRRWQTPGLGVQYLVGAVLPDGLLRVSVLATTLPDALPRLTCPDAPVLPSRPPNPSRRSAA